MKKMSTLRSGKLKSHQREVSVGLGGQNGRKSVGLPSGSSALASLPYLVLELSSRVDTLTTAILELQSQFRDFSEHSKASRGSRSHEDRADSLMDSLSGSTVSDGALTSERGGQASVLDVGPPLGQLDAGHSRREQLHQQHLHHAVQQHGHHQQQLDEKENESIRSGIPPGLGNGMSEDLAALDSADELVRTLCETPRLPPASTSASTSPASGSSSSTSSTVNGGGSSSESGDGMRAAEDADLRHITDVWAAFGDSGDVVSRNGGTIMVAEREDEHSLQGERTMLLREVEKEEEENEQMALDVSNGGPCGGFDEMEPPSEMDDLSSDLSYSLSIDHADHPTDGHHSFEDGSFMVDDHFAREIFDSPVIKQQRRKQKHHHHQQQESPLFPLPRTPRDLRMDVPPLQRDSLVRPSGPLTDVGIAKEDRGDGIIYGEAEMVFQPQHQLSNLRPRDNQVENGRSAGVTASRVVDGKSWPPQPPIADEDIVATAVRNDPSVGSETGSSGSHRNHREPHPPDQRHHSMSRRTAMKKVVSQSATANNTFGKVSKKLRIGGNDRLAMASETDDNDDASRVSGSIGSVNGNGSGNDPNKLPRFIRRMNPALNRKLVCDLCRRTIDRSEESQHLRSPVHRLLLSRLPKSDRGRFSRNLREWEDRRRLLSKNGDDSGVPDEFNCELCMFRMHKLPDVAKHSNRQCHLNNVEYYTQNANRLQRVLEKAMDEIGDGGSPMDLSEDGIKEKNKAVAKFNPPLFIRRVQKFNGKTAFVCDLCRKFLTGGTAMNRHLESHKHKTKVLSEQRKFEKYGPLALERAAVNILDLLERDCERDDCAEKDDDCAPAGSEASIGGVNESSESTPASGDSNASGSAGGSSSVGKSGVYRRKKLGVGSDVGNPESGGNSLSINNSTVVWAEPSDLAVSDYHVCCMVVGLCSSNDITIQSSVATVRKPFPRPVVDALTQFESFIVAAAEVKKQVKVPGHSSFGKGKRLPSHGHHSNVLSDLTEMFLVVLLSNVTAAKGFISAMRARKLHNPITRDLVRVVMVDIPGERLNSLTFGRCNDLWVRSPEYLNSTAFGSGVTLTTSSGSSSRSPASKLTGSDARKASLVVALGSAHGGTPLSSSMVSKSPSSSSKGATSTGRLSDRNALSESPSVNPISDYSKIWTVPRCMFDGSEPVTLASMSVPLALDADENGEFGGLENSKKRAGVNGDNMSAHVSIDTARLVPKITPVKKMSMVPVDLTVRVRIVMNSNHKKWMTWKFDCVTDLRSRSCVSRLLDEALEHWRNYTKPSLSRRTVLLYDQIGQVYRFQDSLASVAGLLMIDCLGHSLRKALHLDGPLKKKGLDSGGGRVASKSEPATRTTSPVKSGKQNLIGESKRVSENGVGCAFAEDNTQFVVLTLYLSNGEKFAGKAKRVGSVFDGDVSAVRSLCMIDVSSVQSKGNQKSGKMYHRKGDSVRSKGVSSAMDEDVKVVGDRSILVRPVIGVKLIPMHATGLVIGRGGIHIHAIKKSTGVKAMEVIDSFDERQFGSFFSHVSHLYPLLRSEDVRKASEFVHRIADRSLGKAFVVLCGLPAEVERANRFTNQHINCMFREGKSFGPPHPASSAGSSAAAAILSSSVGSSTLSSQSSKSGANSKANGSSSFHSHRFGNGGRRKKRF